MIHRCLKQFVVLTAIICLSFTWLPFLPGGIDAHAASQFNKFSAEATGQTTVSLTWARLSKAQQKKASGIAVFRDGTIVKKLSKKSSAFKDSGLDAGTSYTYQIKAYKKTKVRKWYNKKTKKWQRKKPAKKYRGRSRVVVKYSYREKSRVATVTTQAPAGPADPTDPAEPAAPTDSAEPAAPTDPAEPAAPTDPAEPADPTDPAGPSTDTPGGTDQSSVALEIGAPIVIAKKQGTKEDLSWGKFQFPRLYYSGSDLICRVANKDDLATAYEDSYLYYASTDKGDTWAEADSREDFPDHTLLMENGRYFQGAVYENAYASSLCEKYEPAYVSDDGSVTLFYAESIPDGEFPKTFECVEYDPDTKKNIRFTSTLDWPRCPVRVVRGLTCPMAACMYHFRMHSAGTIVKESDGSLLMAVYSQGFHSETGAVVNGKQYNVYLFRSTDCARTWKYVSQILGVPEYCPAHAEGFCEPNLTITPDGSYFILMRTGTKLPCYCACSSDKGATWTDITQFASVGVDPQLLRLDCGVTLASYGRPGIYLRATGDPSCKSWNDEVPILEPDADSTNYIKDSCCYTSLIPTGENTALIAYSLFDYPEGEEADAITKSIVVRRISVSVSADAF